MVVKKKYNTLMNKGSDLVRVSGPKQEKINSLKKKNK